MANPASPKPMRADTERTVRAILEAAERVLSANPAATVEQIAEAAGVARTTVHRRFASRDALIAALAAWATQRFREAVEAARPDTAPPAVALHQATVNVLRVKVSWRFAMDATATRADPEVARVHAGILASCERLFARARDTGLLGPDTDLDWARRVYYALIHEAAAQEPSTDAAVDAQATRVVTTLLHGLGGPKEAIGA
ncbi:helix-turn-helix domain-containing protein [Streptomyces sp. NPDC050703]|uniref:TetR/AcrR family transcriptional regulator n=1 Tax=Streptomyces sp. NPDC050703 TaxID=3157218 RepID=UPI003445D222